MPAHPTGSAARLALAEEFEKKIGPLFIEFLEKQLEGDDGPGRRIAELRGKLEGVKKALGEDAPDLILKVSRPIQDELEHLEADRKKEARKDFAQALITFGNAEGRGLPLKLRVAEPAGVAFPAPAGKPAPAGRRPRASSGQMAEEAAKLEAHLLDARKEGDGWVAKGEAADALGFDVAPALNKLKSAGKVETNGARGKAGRFRISPEPA